MLTRQRPGANTMFDITVTCLVITALLAYVNQRFIHLPTTIGVIVVALLARLLAVGLPVASIPGWFRLPEGAWKILTWGGLRGGISVALALSLPHGSQRDVILALTYAVVVFSILVQGLSIKTMVRRMFPATPDN